MRSGTDTTVYDAVGRVQSQQNGRGYVTSFVYDAAGQQTAILVNKRGKLSHFQALKTEPPRADFDPS